MAEQNTPDLEPPTWADLVEMAQHQLRLIDEGNSLVAKQVVSLAA